jgi:hypothetical protein
MSHLRNSLDNLAVAGCAARLQIGIGAKMNMFQRSS